jgi:hypothetical protein
VGGVIGLVGGAIGAKVLVGSATASTSSVITGLKITTYSTLKKAGMSKAFESVGLKKVAVKNQSLINELNKIGSGWQKVYNNGWLNGQKVSYHYFINKYGRVFDLKIIYKWSSLK